MRQLEGTVKAGTRIRFMQAAKEFDTVEVGVFVPGLLPSLAAIAVKFLPHTLSVPVVGALLGIGTGTSSAPPRNGAH